MSEENHLLEKIETLNSEIEMLKNRVTLLEDKVIEQDIPVKEHKFTSNSQSLKSNASQSDASLRVKNKLTKAGLENVIGGTLLNRIGIVILFLGAAYFLKYSFDNQWIGEIGRVVIGFLTGVSLLLAGDMIIRRNYPIFSQGLTGGGIGIIYLTTFAAVNFYHLLTPVVAFGIMVLTALAGAVLAIRQNALSVALLAAIGGFLTPFLIGSTEANPVMLLSYITVLDLAVLCLAYYKNWRSLNILSFLATAFVFIIYRYNILQADNENVWLNQGFLTLYFLIFGTLAFIYNVRNNKPTATSDVLLILFNAAFFFSASSYNLDCAYNAWLGTLAILMAVIYLLLGLALHKRKLGDHLLFLALLGTGLGFVTISIPIQLNEQWTNLAWLVEAIVLIYAGIKGENIWVRRAGVGLLTIVSLVVNTQYAYFPEPLLPILNYYSLTACLAVIGFFFVAHMYFHETDLDEKERLKVWPAAVIGTILAIKQISWEVTNAIAFFNLDYANDFAVSLAWVLFAVFLMLLGMTKDIKGFRFISLSLFGLTTLKVVFLDLSGMAIIYRVLILFIVGIVLLGVSFIYQRREKKGED